MIQSKMSHIKVLTRCMVAPTISVVCAVRTPTWRSSLALWHWYPSSRYDMIWHIFVWTSPNGTICYYKNRAFRAWARYLPTNRRLNILACTVQPHKKDCSFSRHYVQQQQQQKKQSIDSKNDMNIERVKWNGMRWILLLHLALFVLFPIRSVVSVMAMQLFGEYLMHEIRSV